jgi:hypothetical protein
VRKVFIIRHGEKPPAKPPPNGVTIDGKEDEHSLLPAGWQRAGALNRLFAPLDGRPRDGLATPTELYAPDYGSKKTTAGHRPHETILPLSELVKLEIKTKYSEGEEAALAEHVASETSGVTLICWEHNAILEIARSMPLLPGPEIPTKWPDDRFDVVWCFERQSTSGNYSFGQVPQLLLAGDRKATI